MRRRATGLKTMALRRATLRVRGVGVAKKAASQSLATLHGKVPGFRSAAAF